jgi:hypothetical protein
MLDWNCKHEFMTESLTSSICKLADAMVMSDSLGIIQKFPYLCEKIGSGYDEWYICIKDKLKNTYCKYFGQVD